MLGLLAKHSFIAVCLAVFLEELGIPMPIPSDLLIVFAGAEAGRAATRLLEWFVALSLASVLGASGLYLIVRRGGRPLVERYGRYVHLGPKQLARGERLLERTGWLGIAVGRAIPGLRYVTVIACGLLNVSYWRFVTAHVVGSSVYITVFLALGAVFGPAVTEWLHQPLFGGRLLWTLALAAGLPLLMAYLGYRTRDRRPVEPSRRRMITSVLLSSFLGACSLAAAWAAAAAVVDLLGLHRTLDVTISLAAWLLGRGLSPTASYVLALAGLLAMCIVVSLAYYEILQPRIAAGRISYPQQIFDLSLLGCAMVALVLVPALFARPGGVLANWSQAGGPLFLLVLACGVVCYATTTVLGRTLAITVLPSLRRGARAPAALPAHERIAAEEPVAEDELEPVGPAEVRRA